ncbi:carbohydrate porin [Haloferula helveola]
MVTLVLATAPIARAETGALDSNPLSGPDDPHTLAGEMRQEKADLLDRNLLELWEEWKTGVTDRTGFSFGGDYTAVGFAASDSPGDDTSASGIFRLFGSWDLVNPKGKNTGGLVYKVEHRHRFTDVPPAAFGFEVGYAGAPEPVFNDDGFRVTELNWKQYFCDDRVVARVGFIDIKSYFDVYGLASPWNGFHNLAFSTGSNTQSVLPDGAFGIMIGGYLTDHVYAVAGIADASADPTSVFGGFETFFSDFDTFKSLEIGFTGGGKRLFLDNAHIAIWQLDDSKETGGQGGWGVNASVSKLLADRWLVFLRGGWADEGAGAYEASVSTGFGYMNEPGGHLLGVGLNWGRPNSDTFPVPLDDQWTAEVFYRLQLLENFQLTPSLQFLINPALNPNEHFVALFGLRTRLTF